MKTNRLLIVMSLFCLSTGLQAAESLFFIELKGHETPVVHAVFSPDGKTVATAEAYRGDVRIWDTNSGKEMTKLEGHSQFVNSIFFSPDGKKIVTASFDYTTRIWDVESGKQLHLLQQQEHRRIPSLQAVFSPDGKTVLGGDGIDIKIWDTDSGKELRKLEGHKGMAYYPIFSPDGKKIATASEDGTAKVWDVDTGNELITLHHPRITSAIFLQEGKKLVTGGENQIIIIWETESGKELQKMEGWFCAVSADGKKIATRIMGNIKIWDVDSGKKLQEFEGGIVRTALSGTFSPDGKKIVTVGGSFDSRYVGVFNGSCALIWDVDSGKEIQKLEGHTRDVNSAYFSPDGKKVITTSNDRTARIWILERAHEPMPQKMITKCRLLYTESGGVPLLSFTYPTTNPDKQDVSVYVWNDGRILWRDYSKDEGGHFYFEDKISSEEVVKLLDEIIASRNNQMKLRTGLLVPFRRAPIARFVVSSPYHYEEHYWDVLILNQVERNENIFDITDHDELFQHLTLINTPYGERGFIRVVLYGYHRANVGFAGNSITMKDTDDFPKEDVNKYVNQFISDINHFRFCAKLMRSLVTQNLERESTTIEEITNREFFIIEKIDNGHVKYEYVPVENIRDTQSGDSESTQ